MNMEHPPTRISSSLAQSANEEGWNVEYENLENSRKIMKRFFQFQKFFDSADGIFMRYFGILERKKFFHACENILFCKLRCVFCLRSKSRWIGKKFSTLEDFVESTNNATNFAPYEKYTYKHFPSIRLINLIEINKILAIITLILEIFTFRSGKWRYLSSKFSFSSRLRLTLAYNF